ncbi:pyridoxal 5'-phosphate synthase glutaminase subunit PdxT [Nanoarchaeota archaeon]
MVMRIGILALQGAVREHAIILRKLNVTPVLVTRKEDLKDLDGFIIPGGESTTISDMLHLYNLHNPIKTLHKRGIPIYGTCAGAIILSKNPESKKVKPLGLIDVTLQRNAYGTQKDSFETQINIKNIGKFHGIFIRAPIITAYNHNTQILSNFEDNPIMAVSDNILITTFHPELTKDTRVHELFITMVKKSKV